MIRQPIVAGRFYPGSRSQLSGMVDDLLLSAPDREKYTAIAAVSPHAGYIYSGSVAAETLKAIEIPETVIILGLNHHGTGDRAALSRSVWDMPMGRVPVDDQLADLLVGPGSPITNDEAAHGPEHSVEVQIPFLQALQPNLKIVPIVLSHFSYELCTRVAETLVEAIQAVDKKVLIVASSDMSHYESRQQASAKDKLALQQIEDLNPLGLYNTVHSNNITMCGIIPVTVALIASKKLGATGAKVLRYTDSGAVSGDTESVVGYAGIVIS
ncbi:AmmeMemoRadiSam system protein B [Desulfosediminicola sp.]|uniref:AmmeMemoRadiSam system protein B n=1 Tax=Desulfosediminicola sp. TaxID=2886825 RepID=UPI003AF2C1C1